MTVDEWVEDQLRKAPPMSEATARRISHLLFRGEPSVSNYKTEQHAEMDRAYAAKKAREAAERAERFRLRDSRGQLVVVDRQLTYRWVGQGDLRVGDVVTVPPTYWQATPRSAVVTSLGSDYDGDLVDIAHKETA